MWKVLCVIEATREAWGGCTADEASIIKMRDTLLAEHPGSIAQIFPPCGVREDL